MLKTLPMCNLKYSGGQKKKGLDPDTIPRKTQGGLPAEWTEWEILWPPSCQTRWEKRKKKNPKKD